MTISPCFFMLRNQTQTQERDTRALLIKEMLSARPAVPVGKGGKAFWLCFGPTPKPQGLSDGWWVLAPAQTLLPQHPWCKGML